MPNPTNVCEVFFGDLELFIKVRKGEILLILVPQITKAEQGFGEKDKEEEEAVAVQKA